MVSTTELQKTKGTDQNELDTGFTDIPKIISEEDVDILPYIGWTEEKLKTAHIIGAEDDDMELCSSSSTSHDWNFYCHEGRIRKERSSEIDYCKVKDAKASRISFLEESAAPPDPQLTSRSYFARSRSPSPSEVCIGAFVDSYRTDLPYRYTDTDLEELFCGSGITTLNPPPPRAGALDLSVEALSPQSLFGSLPIESVEPRCMAKRRALRTTTVSARKFIPSSMSDRPPLHGAAVPPSFHHPASFASLYSLSKDDSLLPVGASVQSTCSMGERPQIFHASEISSARVIQFAGPPDSTHPASTRSTFTTPLPPPPPPPSSMMAAVPAFYSQLRFPPTLSNLSSHPRLLSEPLSLCSSASEQLFEASPQQEAQQEVL
ncbi:uncharacterized protein LOC131535078 isoform X2 [Onychostoma macrolepis]|uniref:uncharacterized protein LOC131535078 isoform X2 n=1 Tax=Onychostoma macrolepis TaxID=369639 RepID=UPI00272DA57B|nr:uncharacterized protein LOC131535078 isoform X2 [Onychostoma macrolepis]